MAIWLKSSWVIRVRLVGVLTRVAWGVGGGLDLGKLEPDGTGNVLLNCLGSIAGLNCLESIASTRANSKTNRPERVFAHIPTMPAHFRATPSPPHPHPPLPPYAAAAAQTARPPLPQLLQQQAAAAAKAYDASRNFACVAFAAFQKLKLKAVLQHDCPAARAQRGSSARPRLAMEVISEPFFSSVSQGFPPPPPPKNAVKTSAGVTKPLLQSRVFIVY